MTNRPIEPRPDTVDPHAPPEAPAIICPPEGPGSGPPEYIGPASPTYTPDAAPIESPAPGD